MSSNASPLSPSVGPRNWLSGALSKRPLRYGCDVSAASKSAMLKETSAPADRDVSGPRSLTRLLGIFDVLAKSPDGMSLAELNVALESPKSSLLNLLRPLVAEGYLMHDVGRYRLGPSIFRLSAGVMAAWNFSKILRPFLVDLSKSTNETVYVGVLDVEHKEITYVDVIESEQSVRYSMHIGLRRPLYCTAAGRVLLAHGSHMPQLRKDDSAASVNFVRHASPRGN